jgi:hypothetical protein
VELRHRLEKGLGCPLPVTVAFDYPTVEALAGYLEDELHLADGEDVGKEAVSSEAALAERLEEMSESEVEELLQKQLQERW